jgi:3'(2'), 5'-bisphosphate nucleotidase
MAISRFHDHPDVDVFAAQNRIVQRVAIGSALKYGLLAAAEVDVFPRLVGSSEWDTAAGQAVLEAAGGQVLDWHTGKALQYGKPRRRNPRLLALRGPYQRETFKLREYERELL